MEDQPDSQPWSAEGTRHALTSHPPRDTRNGSILRSPLVGLGRMLIADCHKETDKRKR